MKIALISCSKSKKSYPCPAAEMYSPSHLFSLSYEYAKRVADKVFILSTKYGLLEESDEIKPYELTLKQLPNNRRLDWANYVLGKLKLKSDLDHDEFIILVGNEYYKNLVSSLKHHTLPLGNQPMGQRMSTLKKWLNNEEAISPNQQGRFCESDVANKCRDLHDIFNAGKRYSSSEINRVPFENGIYIMYEKGECYKDFDRIVRVGTHDSPNRLKLRLKDHFIRENKDGSIFRKNIGKAILNRNTSPYLSIWSLDTSKEENKVYVNAVVQRDIEQNVSAYLRENMSFIVFPVEDKNQRLRLEKAIISTLNHCDDFTQSKQWLGNYSTETDIKTSGMWLKRGIHADPLTNDELNFIKDKCLSLENIKTHDSDTSPVSSYSKPKVPQSPSIKTSVSSRVRDYIQFKFDQARSSGKNTCVLVSGDIHKALSLKSRMPIVCNVMYQFKKPGDEVFHTTPSGFSSTIEIKYYL